MSVNWSQFLDNSNIILITGDSRSGKTYTLLNLINHQPHIDLIYLYEKDQYETKYQFLSNKCENVDLMHSDDSKTFFEYFEYSSDIDNIYENIDKENRNKKRKIIIAFDYMIVDMLSNKKLNAIITESFVRGKKLNIFLVFITQFYFAGSKKL